MQSETLHPARHSPQPQQAHSFIFHFYFSDIELGVGASGEGGKYHRIEDMNCCWEGKELVVVVCC